MAAMFCAVFGLFPATAKSTTVVPPTFEEMAERADFVFVGQVVGSAAQWWGAGTNQAIFTQIDFHTEEVQ